MRRAYSEEGTTGGGGYVEVNLYYFAALSEPIFL